MTHKLIYVTHEDHAKLRLLLSAQAAQKSRFAKLRGELERASLVAAASLPPDVVRIGSRFEIMDLDTEEVSTYTLTFLEQADLAQSRLSVLAPIGTAVLGYAAGDEIVWETPGGLRRLQLRRVWPPGASLPDVSAARTYLPSIPQPSEAKAS